MKSFRVKYFDHSAIDVVLENPLSREGGWVPTPSGKGVRNLGEFHYQGKELSRFFTPSGEEGSESNAVFNQPGVRTHSVKVEAECPHNREKERSDWIFTPPGRGSGWFWPYSKFYFQPIMNSITTVIWYQSIKSELVFFLQLSCLPASLDDII